MEEILAQMELMNRIITFAEWLEEGVKHTDDKMLKLVLENYEQCFGDFIEKSEESQNEE